jgi:hypothetical protein
MPQDFTVTVTRSHGQPVTDAFVCVWLEGSIYERGYTDANGVITLPLDGAVTGDLYVTATKQNYLPYQGQAVVNVTNQAPECLIPADTAVLLRLGGQICLPVGCDDPDGNLSAGPVIVSGPGEIVDDQWCYSPAGDEVANVTIRCEDIGGLFCESEFAVTVETFICGDTDAEGNVNVSDVVRLLGYVFESQTAPEPLESGDVNCDGSINVSDVVQLINYVFGDGPVPCDGC